MGVSPSQLLGVSPEGVFESGVAQFLSTTLAVPFASSSVGIISAASTSDFTSPCVLQVCVCVLLLSLVSECVVTRGCVCCGWCSQSPSGSLSVTGGVLVEFGAVVLPSEAGYVSSALDAFASLTTPVSNMQVSLQQSLAPLVPTVCSVSIKVLTFPVCACARKCM